MILNLLCVGLGFLRRPLAIVAALSTALTVAFLNDRYIACCVIYYVYEYICGDVVSDN